MKPSLAFCLLVSLASLSIARADDSAAKSEAQKIVAGQIAAFERDDAADAYSYASPGIRALFPDPELFLAMVGATYAPVHRHRSVEYGPAEEQDGRIAETVIFTDADGQVWNALYKLEKQPDGAWKISGCVLAKSEQTGL